MATYGPQTLNTGAILSTRVSADGSPQYKVGGITLNSASLPSAAGADATLPDGTKIKKGMQYLRYGQVLVRQSGTAEVQSITYSNVTGGTFVIGFNGYATGDIAYDASAADVQSALESLDSIGSGNVSVAADSPDGYTVTFAKAMGNVPSMTVDATNATGSSPSISVSTGTAGTDTEGIYRIYNTSDTLVRGETFILDQTYVINVNGNVGPDNPLNLGGVIQGGRVWLDRILHNGTTTGSTSNGPKLSDLLAAMPNLLIVKN